ncbi:competence pheromone ComX [Paenibacillus albidus]|uniref:competence pheromone ComX n=1 Tax=Paenibacillus albidus TaxID=2041023 RepID=UPI001BECEBA0|nr:competence pheromone ComX [Paenibacillus albidus]
MCEIISYLKSNPEVIELVRSGDASLIGISKECDSSLLFKAVHKLIFLDVS